MTEDIQQKVLDFWFGEPGSEEHGAFRTIWFRGRTPEFDQEIRDGFMEIHEKAAGGEFDHWVATKEGCLALCILLDQFPRNMFRMTPRAFATDAKAREVAKHAVANKWDDEVSAVERHFFYLPYEHSEELADLDAVTELAPKMGRERSVKAVAEHRDLIVRFGRYPHRNEILGRESTPEEIEHMKNGGKNFGQGATPDPLPDDQDDAG